MIFTIEYADEAKKSIALFKKSNQVAFNKLVKLVEELHEHPRFGTGHPEPLKRGNSITYSRTITKKHRLVYDVHDDALRVDVLRVEGHYDDK
jgi:toxin YoeB